MTKQRLLIVVLAAALAASAGCSAGRAFRRGEEASRVGNWDEAVAHFQEAVQDDPDSPEYKIALERAMQRLSEAVTEAVARSDTVWATVSRPR